MTGTRDTKRSERQRHQIPSRGDRRLHQRRQVLAAQPAHRRRGAGRGLAVRHPRPDHPQDHHRRRPRLHDVRHRRLRPAPAAPAGRGVPLDAGGGRRLRPGPARRRRLAPRPRGSAGRGPRGVRRDRRRQGARARRDQQGRRGRPDGASPGCASASRTRVVVSAKTGEGIARGARRRSRPTCRTRRWSSTRCCPTSAATCSTRSTSTARSTSLEHTGDGHAGRAGGRTPTWPASSRRTPSEPHPRSAHVHPICCCPSSMSSKTGARARPGSSPGRGSAPATRRSGAPGRRPSRGRAADGAPAGRSHRADGRCRPR